MPVGLVRVRFIRPWPRERLLEALSGAKGVIVFDRAVSMGSVGPLFADVAQTLYPLGISMKGVIAGLTGVDVKPSVFEEAIAGFIKEAEEGPVYVPSEWLLPRKYRGKYPSIPREVIAR